tara:strand:- start:16 stop:597 length:582 start_codon:yes stop_codon:yes gene_type:complete
VKYFNVVFWVALIGIIFYFTIDSRDIKNVLEPINNKVSDLVEGKTPEEIIEKYISSNNTKIIDIEASKKYFCDVEFSLKDVCNEMFSNTTYTGEGDKCEQDFLLEYTKNKIQIYGQNLEKSQESCNVLKDDLDTTVDLISTDIRELELVLSEGRAREYLKENELDIKTDLVDDEESTIEKSLLQKAKEKQKGE